MPNALLETLSSLVFPVLCEICGQALNPNPPSGICEKCAASIKKIAAPHCHGCGRTLIGQTLRCADCQNESYSYDSVFACASYEGPMRELIHAYKFKHRKYLKHFFIRMAEEFIRSNIRCTHLEITLPVPIGAHRSLERGFNQSELISMAIARNLNLRHSSGNLVRTKSETAQSLLTKNDRKINVKGAFSVKRPELLKSKNLLLIDDILTTGQTASECARILKEAGASSVTVLAMARGV